VREEREAEPVAALYQKLPGDIHVVDLRTAEMLKYVNNSFHALKVAFANEVGRLCQRESIDSHEVMRLMCMDTKLNLSPYYLRPGFAFGGSCLPKDLRATMYLAKIRDVELPMLGNVLASNRMHVDHAIAKVLASGRRRVGMIGLSFKTGTDDLRESPLVTIAEQFIGKGLSLLVYDPEVHLSRLLGANRRFIEQHVPHIGSLMREGIEAVIDESDVLVVGLSDKKIFEAIAQRARGDQIILDLVNIPGREALPGKVMGLCW
jgi:GDP-mannose 6-dehydrogenase